MADKYFKIIFCVLLVFLLFALNGCKSSYSSYREPGRYYDDKSEFSVKFPEGWKLDEKRDHEGLVITALSGHENDEDFVNESIMIDVRYLWNKPPLEDWFKELDSASKSLFYSYKVKERGDITVGGREGKWLVFTYKQDGADLINMSFIMVNGRYGYLISCHTDSHKFEEYRSLFEEVANSFRIES
jgi:hypothetical protein